MLADQPAYTLTALKAASFDGDANAAMEAAKTELPREKTAPLLIQPTVLHGLLRHKDTTPEDPGQLWWALPEITTIARFDSHAPARGQDCYASSLVLVWFQTHWGAPVDPALLAKIKAVDWNVAAWDWIP